MLNIIARLFNSASGSALQKLKHSYDQTPMEIALYDHNRNCVFLNTQYFTNGFDKETFVGKEDSYYFEKLQIDSASLKKRADAFTDALEQKKTVRFTEKLYFPHTNKTMYFKRIYQPVFLNGDDSVSHVAFFGSNLTAIILSQKELKYLAFHDKLTGLGNRDFFNQQLEQMIVESARRTDEQVSAVLFCDLDNFKLVNDSLGHDVGDLVLIEAAERIKKSLRLSDSIFRLGGDEFTIILKELKQDVDAGTVAQKLIESVSKPYKIHEHTITYLTMSAGIAMFPKDGKDRETLTSNADMAMYEAKKHAKNNFKYFSEDLTQSAKERLRIVKGLKELIQQNDFERQFNILYQPIYEKISGGRYSIVGSEALLRWNHPKQGNISPALFIPIAEESNLIQHFGEWILQRSLTDFQYLGTLFPDKALYISVNLSAKQLNAPGLVDILHNTVRKIGVPYEKIQLEITETSIIDDSNIALKNLFKLSDMGFRLAIDDFGVGFASLSYLQKFPASVIKIDRTFVQQALTSKQNSGLVKSIILLGKNLDIEVIAEGVENQNHLDFLDAAQCYKYQGYHFSRPLLLTDFEKKLKEEQNI